MDIFFTMIILWLLAIVPAIVWVGVFNKENPKWILPDLFAIIAWWLSTVPVLFYQKLWWAEGNFIFFKAEAVNFQDNISQLFWFSSFSIAAHSVWDWSFISAAIAAVFFVFVWVWFLEEFFKHVVINPKFTWVLAFLAFVSVIWLFITSNAWIYVILWIVTYFAFLFFMPRVIKFKSIDDAISVSVLAAIWFSLVENLIYFYFKWTQISDMLWVDSIFEANFAELSWFFAFVLIRVSVVTMIHVLCSWVFGYHFWLAHFAHPELEEEIRQWRKHPIVDFFHKIFKTPEEKVFTYEQLFLALFLSIMLHWVYDVIAQLNFSIWPIPLMALAMPLYFIWWFYYLFTLLEEKKNKIRYWKLVVKEEYV